MAFRIKYQYLKQQKEIGYANDKYLSVFDAIGKAEGVDLVKFHRLETQLVNVTRNDKQMVKGFREEYFRKLGFSQITISREV